jgi:hypothetical protein
MRILKSEELSQVEGAGISLDWIEKVEEETGRTRVDTGLQINPPEVIIPIVEDYTWVDHPFFNTERDVPPWHQ